MPVPTAARRAKRVIDSETPSPSAEEVEVEDEDELDEDDEGDEDEDEGDEDDELDELDEDSDDPLAGSLSEGSEFDATPEPSSVKIKLRVGGAAPAARGGRASRTASRGGRAAAAAAASTATPPSARPTRAAAAPAGRRGRAAAATASAAPAPAASTSTRAAAASASASTTTAAGKRKREPTADDEDDEDLEEEEGAEGEEEVDEDDEFAAGGEDGALSPSKMTARQRAKQNKDLQDTLMALPDGLPKTKPILTEAERLQKREEMARRRKRQNEQRLQDEQDQTINRLLRAQTGRSRSKLDHASPMPDDSSAGGAGAAGGANGSALPSGMSSPVRRAPRLAEGVHYRSALEGDAVVLSVSVPKGREEWIALGAEVEEKMEVDGGKVVGVREVAMCAVAGCGEKRKYRCVKAFDVGGCSLAHLKEVEKGLEVKA